MLTKSDVQQRIAGLDAQEKQMFANLNFLLGQKSVLEAMLVEMPDDPKPEGELPEMAGVPRPEVPERVPGPPRKRRLEVVPPPEETKAE